MGLLRGSSNSSNNNNSSSSGGGGGGSSQPNDKKLIFTNTRDESALNNNNSSNDPRKLVAKEAKEANNNEGNEKQSWGEGDDDDDFVSPSVPQSAAKGGAKGGVAVTAEEEIKLDNNKMEDIAKPMMDETTKKTNNDGGDDVVQEPSKEKMDTKPRSSSTVASTPQQGQQQMLDLSNFTKVTTLCQDDPTFVHSTSQKSCTDLFVDGVGEKNELQLTTCNTFTGINNDDESEGEKRVRDFCKRSCGLCNNDDIGDDSANADAWNGEDDKAVESEGGKTKKKNDIGEEEEEEVVDTAVDEEEEETSRIKEATTLDEVNTTDKDDGDGKLNEETKEGEMIKVDREEFEEIELLKNNEGANNDKVESTLLEEDESGDGDESVDDDDDNKKKNVSGMESAEKETLTFKEADEDDAFIPEQEEGEVKKGEGAKKQIEKGTEDELEDKSKVKDLKSAQEEEEDTETTNAGSKEEATVTATTTTTTNEEEVSTTDDKDDEQQQLETEMEGKLETTAFEEGIVDDEDTAEKLEKEMEEALEDEEEEGVGKVFEKELEEELDESGGSDKVSGAAAVEDDEKVMNKVSLKGEEGEAAGATTTTEVASKAKDDSSSLCQDDTNFTFKGYDGFNCEYIKENKLDKCDKMHDGVKVGLSSCPVSCDMVDECMALLQKQLNNAAEEKSVGEQGVTESEEEAPPAVIANNDESAATEQKDTMQLEKEMENELEAALEKGTVDEETAEKLDEEMFEALEEGVGEVFEKELEEELGLVAGGEDNSNEQEVADESSSKEKAAAAATKVDDHLTTIGLSFNEATVELDGPPVVANLTIGEDDLSFCQDDPDFKYKGYEGYNCEYIKENKPDKCDKLHDGEKVGVLSCPVSCGMVDECKALQEAKVDAALGNVLENKETESSATLEEDTVATGTTTEETVDDGSEAPLDEQESIIVTEDEGNDALEGTKDDEPSDETGVQVDGTQVGAKENTTVSVTSEEEAVVTETVTEKADEGSEEPLKEQTSVTDEKNVEADDTTLSGLCQDDPDFNFKGYAGFNCDYIKENKPEKCDKVHDGEKVGVVSCPVSCNMVGECMALQKQKGSADDTQQLGSDENETVNVTADDDVSKETGDPTEASTVINEEEVITKTNEDEVVDNEEDGLDEKSAMTDEDETKDETNVDTITTNGVCQDDPDFNFKGYEGFNCEYIKNNKPEKCDKLHFGEKIGVVSCPVSCDMVDECMARQQEKETGDAEVDVKENDETIGDEEVQVEKQVTTVPSESQEDDDLETKGEQGLADQELEKEIEAKLEKAVEEGELDEEEAEELEEEMEEALEEGAGEIFEEELDKELRCKDDPEFLYMDGDLERDCLWIHQNERCDHVHKETGKVIGKFFCPETCGMKEECEKVTAADSSLQAPEVEDTTSGKEGDDAFETVPKGTKSMEDEIEIESELENGNIYGTENVESISGGDTATNSFTYNQNENGAVANLSDDAYADEGDDNFNNEGEDVMYNKYKDTENLNQWDNMDGLPASQEFNQEPNSNVGYSQPTNGVDNWQGYGGENQQEGNSFDNIDYDENWLDDDGGFPFGLLILLFLGVGFFIFRKSQSSRQQDHSRGGYQRVGRRIDVQEHNKRY
jgi:hypothetical protein